MNKPTSQPLSFYHIVCILLLLSLVVAVYYPGLSGPFLLDDFPNIVEKEEVHMTKVDFQSWSQAATAYGSRYPYRPVSTISLALDYRLWGEDPFGFKATNLGIHLVTCVLIFMLARQLFRLSAGRDDERDGFWPALAVAGLWALHPLQISTVLYVVQRMEMLSALFIVLSLLAYIGGRIRLQAGVAGGWWLLAAAGVSTLLALFSKETGALAPFFMLAVELLVFRFATAPPKAAYLLKVAYGAIVAGTFLLYLLWIVPEALFGDSFIQREFTWTERLLTQMRVLPMYLAWVLVPAIDQYVFYYDYFPHSESLFKPITTLLGGLLLLGLALVAWLLRSRAPLAALGILWFFIAHALTSNLVSLELVFEHRNYLAIFGVLLAITGGVRALRLGSKRKPVIVALTVCIVVGLSLIGAIRSATWGDRMTFALHHAKSNPLSERAGLELSLAYLGRADIRRGLPFLVQARNELERVAALPTSRTIADRGLIVMAARLGEDVPHEYWQRLLEKVRVRALNHSDHDALYDLAEQRQQGLELSDAYLWELHKALCGRSDIPHEVHVRFGHYAASVLEDSERATSAFRRALELLSDSPKEQEELRATLREEGRVLVEGIGPCSVAASEGPSPEMPNEES